MQLDCSYSTAIKGFFRVLEDLAAFLWRFFDVLGGSEQKVTGAFIEVTGGSGFAFVLLRAMIP